MSVKTPKTKDRSPLHFDSVSRENLCIMQEATQQQVDQRISTREKNKTSRHFCWWPVLSRNFFTCSCGSTLWRTWNKQKRRNIRSNTRVCGNNLRRQLRMTHRRQWTSLRTLELEQQSWNNQCCWRDARNHLFSEMLLPDFISAAAAKSQSNLRTLSKTFDQLIVVFFKILKSAKKGIFSIVCCAFWDQIQFKGCNPQRRTWKKTHQDWKQMEKTSEEGKFWNKKFSVFAISILASLLCFLGYFRLTQRKCSIETQLLATSDSMR